MKRVYVNEQWCLGCHLCEYYCAFANSGKSDMVKALKGTTVHPNIRIEEGPGGVSFAVACRHCTEPLCVKGCISGALQVRDGVVTIDGIAELSSATDHPQRLTQYLAKYDNRIREGLESTPERYTANFSTAIKISLKTIRAW